MLGRPLRARRAAVAAGCCVLGAAALLAGATGAGAPAGTALHVLQLNLCDSGIAPCYSGRSVAAAAAVIRTSRPDVVTLNEVCRGDVRALARAMTAAEPDARVVSAFDAAADRRTGGPIRCVNGQPYGIGVLAGASTAVDGPRTFAGRYPIQDPTDPEERVWLCIHAEADSYACTTHTANTSTAVALAQCRYLLDVALPRVVGRGGMERVVVGADLNLPADASPGPGSCVPHGYRRADDGSRQDVVASVQYAITSRTDLDLHGTTDHPGLLVALVRR